MPDNRFAAIAHGIARATALAACATLLTALPAEAVIEELTQAGYRLKQEHGFLPNQYFLVFEPVV
ncbi:hypothetical protein [Zeimonas arvi]|uniref:Uncharacterized protein n=1 Tax=Zeimonas arvi TaxID=2498847 RepID=A0A5C8P5V2_9BURK|nr:hypothetical protein [Zeimonas arvi]TXL68605.1 hypothetical protein FHP08_02675 [Zeimonas arvi]